ncbi:MAG: prenyltransferase [Cyanobacteria bacterium SIG26]|nr:prenyltransferase [Cyanobacteria bacterium SIG26]
MKKIINIFKIIKFWFNCARVYSLPITILNGLVIFIFALKQGGNPYLGLLAILGSSLVHMATNLIDDYFDYKILLKDKNYINSAQNCKCLYLKNGQASTKELKYAILAFLTLAGIIGGALFFLSGPYVLLLAIIGLIIALTYQKFSLKGLGEIAVIIAYGPLLYEGIYYVMTNHFSLDVLLLSLACALFTNSILYAHMLMDFDGDKCSHKKTLCTYLKTKQNALNFILFFYIGGYLLISIIAFKTENYWYLLTFLTIPQVAELFYLLEKYNKNNKHLPKIKIWHYPLDNWKILSKTDDAPFYFRFFYARNIMTNFMLQTCLAIILN